MNSSWHLSSTVSSHLHPRVAGLLAKTLVPPRARALKSLDNKLPLHEIQRLCGIPSSCCTRGGLNELQRTKTSGSRRAGNGNFLPLGRSFAIAAASAGSSSPLVSPTSRDLGIALVPESGFSDGNVFRAPSSVYVHIPFCRRRCFYCDFTIVAVGERTDRNSDHQDSIMVNYVDLLCKEIAFTARKRTTGNGPSLETIFFGGGTPSLLPVYLLKKIIDELRSHFQVSENAEIAMEIDPGTFDGEKLKGYIESGISRVSLGVQSFQDELLKSCGRSHGLQQVYDAVDAIHLSGLENWSLDLIASLPNQSSENWEHSLRETIAARPAHVSVYDLQIEEGTLFNRWYRAGESPLPSDDNAAEFYRMASLRLREAGYEHYEVSNYARPGYHCKHNLVYWENRPYYAFGLGSTSYVEGRRFSRPKKMKEYMSYVENLEASSKLLVLDQCPQNSVEDQVLDTIMLSLRLSRGLNLLTFEAAFGFSVTATVCNRLLRFVDIGLVEALDSNRCVIPAEDFIRMCSEASRQGVGTRDPRSEAHRERVPVEYIANRALEKSSIMNFSKSCETKPAYVRLTDPEGFLLSNEVISSIFSALPSGGV